MSLGVPTLPVPHVRDVPTVGVPVSFMTLGCVLPARVASISPTGRRIKIRLLYPKAALAVALDDRIVGTYKYSHHYSPQEIQEMADGPTCTGVWGSGSYRFALGTLLTNQGAWLLLPATQVKKRLARAFI